MNEIDQFVEHVMEMIASRRIDKEELKKKLISNWSELDKRGEKLMKEMKEILKDAGATDAQIEWGINLPKLSWRKEKRMRELDLPFYRFQITEIKAYSIGDEFKIKPVMVVLKYKPEQSDMEIDAAFNKCEFGVLLEDIVRYTGRTYSIDELEGVING